MVKSVATKLISYIRIKEPYNSRVARRSLKERSSTSSFFVTLPLSEGSGLFVAGFPPYYTV